MSDCAAASFGLTSNFETLEQSWLGAPWGVAIWGAARWRSRNSGVEPDPALWSSAVHVRQGDRPLPSFKSDASKTCPILELWWCLCYSTRILGKHLKLRIDLRKVKEGRRITSVWRSICIIERCIFSVWYRYIYCWLNVLKTYFSTCWKGNVKRVVRKMGREP